MSSISQPVIITSFGVSQDPDAMNALREKLESFTEICFLVSFDDLRPHTLKFEHLLYGDDSDRLNFITKYESIFKQATSHGDEVMDLIPQVSIVAMTSTELHGVPGDDTDQTDGLAFIANYLGPLLDEESQFPWVVMVWDEVVREIKLEQETVA